MKSAAVALSGHASWPQGCQFRSRVAGAGYIVVILLGPTGTLLGPTGTLGWLGLGPAAAAALCCCFSAAAAAAVLELWGG